MDNIAIAVGTVKPDSAAPILAAHAVAIRKLAKRVWEDVVEIGRRLNEVRGLIEPGQWLTWIETEFGWSDQTARRFIHVFEFSRDPEFNNLLNLPDLPISVLYQLAAPKAEQFRKEIAGRIEAGEQLSCADIKKTIAAKAEPKTTPIAHRYDWRTGEETVEVVADDALTAQFIEAPEVVDQDQLRNKIIDDFFTHSTGEEILERLPAAMRTEVCRSLLDQLGVDAVLAAMSAEFGRELRDRVPKSPKPRKTLTLTTNSSFRH